MSLGSWQHFLVAITAFITQLSFSNGLAVYQLAPSLLASEPSLQFSSHHLAHSAPGSPPSTWMAPLCFDRSYNGKTILPWCIRARRRCDVCCPPESSLFNSWLSCSVTGSSAGFYSCQCRGHHFAGSRENPVRTWGSCVTLPLQCIPQTHPCVSSWVDYHPPPLLMGSFLMYNLRMRLAGSCSISSMFNFLF